MSAALLLSLVALGSGVWASAGKSPPYTMGGFASPAIGKPQTGLKTLPLRIEAAGKTFLYTVEVAATPEQQAIGMMFRTDMPAKTGMLFLMNPPRFATFYMRNTFIPLDIIFIDANGRVLNITTAVPLTDTLVPSAGKAAAVLELAGGEAARIGLKAGDRVRW
jgi:uncharacterized membrane protein (UPF0127 family)